MDNEEYWKSMSDFGRGRNDDPDYGPIPEEYLSTGMSKAALICGLLSLVCLLFNYLGVVLFGSLGVLFALLSRRSKMSRQARTGMTLSIAGLILFGAVTAFSFYTLKSTGVWDYMMKEIREMDPNDPYAAGHLQQDILSELQKRLRETYL